MSENVQEFKDDNWEADVLGSDVPVLVDFWAPWCAPCRAIAPSIEALASEYEGKARFGKLNIDENPQVTMKYAVRSIPTLIMFKGGSAVGQLVGGLPKGRIEEMVKKALDKAV